MQRFLLSISVALALVLGVASASAAPMKWHGTLTLQLATLSPIGITGSAIATVNGSTGYGHLNQVYLDGGFAGGQTVPITDPEVTQANGLISVRVTVTDFGPGTFGNISGGPPISPNQLPVGGVAKLCLYDPNCLPASSLILPLNTHTAVSGTEGLGVGGLISVGGFGGLRVSVVANPWTIGTVTALDQTDNGAIVVASASGFVHGPASLTTSTAKPSGMVQFVTPLQVSTNLTTGSNEVLALFGRATFHFIPEPGVLLLLGSGVAGLALVGRSRMKK